MLSSALTDMAPEEGEFAPGCVYFGLGRTCLADPHACAFMSVGSHAHSCDRWLICRCEDTKNPMGLVALMGACSRFAAGVG